jgi:hypothetical protein
MPISTGFCSRGNCRIALSRCNGTNAATDIFAAGGSAVPTGWSQTRSPLTPRYFRERPVDQVLSTLVHEMTHLWQHHGGKPGRGGYHNREWAERMKLIGLHPSSTGKEGGQETGDSVSHYIVSAGPFEVAANELLMTGFAIAWTEKPPETDTAPVKGGEGPDQEPKSGKRVKYTCPCCRLNAWAKHRVQLVCGRDMTPMEPAG